MGTRTKGQDAGGRPNKIRFVMLEADLSDGNLSELTNAITSALRPAVAVSPRPIERIALKAPADNSTLLLEPQSSDDDEQETDETTVAAGIPPKPSAPRKLPLPGYLHDLDTTGQGISLKEFVAQHQTKKHLRRFLVASYWLREYGKHESVNADKVYTCYKTVGWSTDINDWDSNFRNHVKFNRMRRVAPGEYTLTPIGESEIQAGDSDKV